MHPTPFVDPTLHDLRRRQHEVLAFLPDDVREPLLPSLEDALGPPPEACPLAERALRERVEEIVASYPQLQSYLERARRHRFASAVAATINERYRELAGDGPAAMDDELTAAKEAIDPSVEVPSYEDQMLVARIVPLISWADFLAARAAGGTTATST